MLVLAVEQLFVKVDKLIRQFLKKQTIR